MVFKGLESPVGKGSLLAAAPFSRRIPLIANCTLGMSPMGFATSFSLRRGPTLCLKFLCVAIVDGSVFSGPADSAR